jgi:putative endonuclease
MKVGTALGKGAQGELLARQFLAQNGYTIIHTNYKCRIGEIDIIALQGEVLCFVEVRSRYSSTMCHPLESVGWIKQGKIKRIAELFLSRNGKYGHLKVRFDIVTILQEGQRRTLQHIPDAFR